MPACVRCVITVLPWFLLAASATCLALGLSWRHLTDADTVNGSFLIASIVLAALTFATLCVREIPDRVAQKDEKQSSEASARLPMVTVA